MNAVLLLLLSAPHATAATSSTKAPNWPALDGKWAFLQVTAAVSDAPLFGEVTSETRALALLEIEQKGPDLRMKERLCELETENPIPTVSTEYPAAFIRALSGATRQAHLERDDEGHLLFVQPRLWKVDGVKTVDVAALKLPTSSEDPSVLDPDSDGHPGLTVRVNGIVSGDVRVVSKGWTSLKAELSDPSRIQGEVRWHTEQRILETTNGLLDHQPNPSPHPDPKRSWFRMVRVEGSAGCEAARGAQRL